MRSGPMAIMYRVSLPRHKHHIGLALGFDHFLQVARTQGVVEGQRKELVS